ncbi:DHA2 family efflux MFS transporter permease subunit [Oxalobacteraceae bacterium OM1]|nr:DHA2 family efflux MFS transporter permease subunit [Oxalobacteraceae bacterium OM1]
MDARTHGIIDPASMSTLARVLAFGSMSIGMFIALLDIQIVSASLRDIGSGLAAGADEVTWVQTSYLIAEIISIPLSGWLSGVLSTRWLFALSAVGFTASSILCGLAWNIQSMIAFRALQGFLGGAMIPMVFTTSFAFFQGKQRVIAAATIGGIASLAPTLGPTVGGWITDHFSWPWLFYVNLIPGAFVSIAVPMMVKIDRPNLALLRDADYPGIVLMSLFLGCLEYALEEGPRLDWLADPGIAAAAWTSLIAAVLFVWRSLTHDRPILDLRALGQRNFALGCLFSFVIGIGIFATIYLTPVYLSRVRGYGALQIGLAVFSTGAFQILSIPVYSYFANRVDLRWLMMFGLACFALSMWEFSAITHDWGAAQLLLPQALRGIGQQFAIPPTVTLTLGSLAPARLRLASGLFNLMRNLGGALGIAACATVLNDRTNLHFHRLAERLSESNAAMTGALSTLSERYTSASGDVAGGQLAALKQLWQLTYREALTMTFGDVYVLIMGCFIATVLLVPLMHKVAPPKTPSPDAH